MYNNEIKERLNQLLQLTFQLNSFSDNCAYWLVYNYFMKTEKFFHEKFAHIFPKWADTISEFMVKLNMRPVRLSLVENTVNYTNHKELFSEVYDAICNYRQYIFDTIEIAEINEYKEIVVFLEEYVLNMLPYVKQADIWKKRAMQIDDVPKFDKYFNDFSII